MLGRYGPEEFRYPSGRPAAFVEFEVMLRGTTTHATLFDDIEGEEPIANPVKADSEGNLTFVTEGEVDYDLYPEFGGKLEIYVDSPLGSQGTPGLDAYQLALLDGFVGTRTQWLASLKGAKGDAGDFTGALAYTAYFAVAPSPTVINGRNQYIYNITHNLGFVPAAATFRPTGGDPVAVPHLSTTTTTTVQTDVPATGYIDLS